MSQEDTKKIVRSIATQLGEKEKTPLIQIRKIVEKCGVEFAQTILKETLEVEAKGGMMVNDGTRRRTPGGVFFYLARGRLPSNIRNKIFGSQKKAKNANQQQGKKAPAETIAWDERMPLIQPLLEVKGTATNVKVTLIGRPGKIDNSKKDLVVTSMEYALRNPALPKGVPTPPSEPTTYTIYIAAKQWSKVAEAIEDPEDALIVEGSALYDPQIKGVAIFAQSVTTKLLQRQKREAQAAGDAEAAPKPKPAPVAAGKSPAAKAPAAPPPPPLPEIEVNIPEGVPPAVAEKLRELYMAAGSFRQKLNELNSNPEGKQFTINMTQKLLKNTEDQIAALLAQHTSS